MTQRQDTDLTNIIIESKRAEIKSKRAACRKGQKTVKKRQKKSSSRRGDSNKQHERKGRNKEPVLDALLTRTERDRNT